MTVTQDVLDHAGKLGPGLVGISAALREPVTVSLTLARARARDCHVSIDGRWMKGVQSFHAEQTQAIRDERGRVAEPSVQQLTVVVRRKRFDPSVLPDDRPVILRLEVHDPDTGVPLIGFDTNLMRLTDRVVGDGKDDTLVFTDLVPGSRTDG